MFGAKDCPRDTHRLGHPPIYTGTLLVDSMSYRRHDPPSIGPSSTCGWVGAPAEEGPERTVQELCLTTDPPRVVFTTTTRVSPVPLSGWEGSRESQTSLWLTFVEEGSGPTTGLSGPGSQERGLRNSRVKDVKGEIRSYTLKGPH